MTDDEKKKLRETVAQIGQQVAGLLVPMAKAGPVAALEWISYLRLESDNKDQGRDAAISAGLLEPAAEIATYSLGCNMLAIKLSQIAISMCEVANELKNVKNRVDE